jgi:uncharacterized protein with GYD domain
MPKYLLKARYTVEGLSGVMRDGGSARRAAANDLAKQVGGSVEAFYFAFGEEDAIVICDLPDNAAAARLALTVSSSGRVAVTTVPLLTVEEIDEISASEKLNYVAPGS